jgi:hypothetical protein
MTKRKTQAPRKTLRCSLSAISFQGAIFSANNTPEIETAEHIHNNIPEK